MARGAGFGRCLPRPSLAERSIGVVALVSATAFVAVGFRDQATEIETRTVACSTRSFTVTFDPKRSASVRGMGSILGFASFTAARLNTTCRTVPEPKAFLDGGLGGEINRRVTIRCTAAAQIRVHVNPITHNGEIVGSNLLVGTGTRLRVIVSAVLKDQGKPYGKRIYLAARYCRIT